MNFHETRKITERGTNMKRTLVIAILAGIIAVGIFAPDASAYYHPGMGVFISRDPGAGGAMRIGAGGPAAAGGFVPRDPTGQYADGMNLYQYVGSNPANYVDPSGLIKGKGKYCDCSRNDKNAWRKVDTIAVLLYGSANTRDNDYKHVNDVYTQCCIEVKWGVTSFWSESMTVEAIGKDLVLDEYTKLGTPTMEETLMTLGHGNFDGVLFVYYVKALSQRSTGESFWPAAWKSPPAPAIVLSNTDKEQTFPHELGHVLLDNGGHHPDKNNLMFIINQKYELTEAQCDQMRKSPLVK